MLAIILGLADCLTACLPGWLADDDDDDDDFRAAFAGYVAGS